MLALGSYPSNYHRTYKPKPLPCVTHKGLAYSPVLVKFNISGSYTMKDLSTAQRTGYQILMEDLQSKNYGKYQLADGVTPNLTADVVVNNDSYEHYGATVHLYVYDGSSWFTLPTNYITPEKLFDDIATKLNTFISYGWCNNCPDPCNP